MDISDKKTVERYEQVLRETAEALARESRDLRAESLRLRENSRALVDKLQKTVAQHRALSLSSRDTPA